jgi:hypothetical protein
VVSRAWARAIASLIVLGHCVAACGDSTSAPAHTDGEAPTDAGSTKAGQADPAPSSPDWSASDAAATPPERGPWFVEHPAGVDHVNLSGPPGAQKRYLLDCIGQGVATLDIDSDGRLDLYFPQGRGAGDASNLLYINRGERQFERVPDAAGADDDGYSFGALAFDWNGDGRTDLLSTDLGPNRLYRNDDGRFVDVSADHPDLRGPAEHWSTGAAAADVDLDGDLDVYLANYLAHDPVDLDERSWCRFMGCEVPCGPMGLTPQPDRLLRNDDGRFVDATEALGFTTSRDSFGFQPIFSDIDDDGDLDLYVTNDSRVNYLWIAGDDGRFHEEGLTAGVGVGRAGNMEAGMGVAVASVDGDVLPELYVTNFSTQVNAFYRNQSEPGFAWFDEQANELGMGTPTYFKLSWGCSFGDFDLDGRMDLFVSNGHVFPQVAGCPPEEIVYEMTDTLFVERDGDRLGYRDLGAEAGPGFGRSRPSRGSASADLDGDGDLDLVIVILDEAPVLLWNESPRAGAFLQLLVQERAATGDAWRLSVGARVVVTAGAALWVREVQVGSSFLSTEDPRCHFGLGDRATVDKITVRWPDGHEQHYRDVATGQLLRLRRGVDTPLSGHQKDH